ncbi:sigma factor-like helix-turn-helix DNA-binding protein [Faecalicatena orotica]|uniref:sigma factor-like helix-turn-helix DNA-binding protein n=2 Tax=Clostridia TaxID=186801 RepID=UPI0015FD47ED|nr:sigma factor-like helix-turn-helix DNA-binding protein [Faecalicatena orotica]
MGRKAGEEAGMRKGKELGVQEARQVFKLYMQGKSLEEIADLCNISTDKVKQILE